jgi:single-strand DNA-binding protein
MANSMAVLSRRLYRSLLSSNPKISQLSMPFCTSSTTTTTTTNNLSFREEESELDGSDTHSVPNSTTSSSPSSSSSTTTSEGSSGSRMVQDRPLENGLDAGVYKVNATLY